MKLRSLFLLSIAAWFLPQALSAGSCEDCSCCRENRCCAPTSAKGARNETAVAAAPSPAAVQELERLASRYIQDAAARTAVLADLRVEPQRAYTHPLFKLALFTPSDAKSYQALAADFDC